MTRGAWLAAALCAAPAAGAAQLVDPLDLPARPSALAPRSLLNGVTAAGTRLVAVGQRGHVLWSDDGGARWTQAAVPVSTDLVAVRFASPERGWAVGHDGVVLATSDGGASWTTRLDGRRLGALLATWYAAHPGARDALPGRGRSLATGPDQPLLDAWLDAAGAGFAVGAFGLVLRTDDGGERWIPWLHRVDNPRGLHLYAVGRAAGETWIVGEQGLVLRLDPARQRFRAAAVPYRGTFFGLAGAGRAVIVFGLRGNAFRSVDGGASWSRLETGVDEALTGAAEMQDGRLVLVTATGRVLVSADGGASFRAAPLDRALPASSVAPAGPDAVAIAGAAGVRLARLR